MAANIPKFYQNANAALSGLEAAVRRGGVGRLPTPPPVITPIGHALTSATNLLRKIQPVFRRPL